MNPLCFLITFVILIASCCSQNPLYGVVTEFAANLTETTVYTVKVFQNGTTENVVENFRYLGGSIAYDGISTFDQRNKILYYAVNFESAFVYAVDVVRGNLVAPISIGATWIENLEWDPKFDDIYAEAVYVDSDTQQITAAVVSFSTNSSSPTRVVANLTELGIENVGETALDWNSGIYYLTYLNSSTAIPYLGSFLLNSAKTSFSTFRLDCGGFSIDFLSFEPNSNTLIGVGVIGSPSLKYSILSIEIPSGKCSSKPIEVNGVITASSYDPTISTIYIGVAPDRSPQLYSYSLKTSKLSSVPTTYILEDVQASYQLK